MTRKIDLRSDTVTLPTPAMLEAMYRAELGDDGFREDPTVAALEQISAQKIGKEAGLFVPSGTMANLVSLLTHCCRGDEVLMGDQAHILLWEGAGAAGLGGLQIRTVPNLRFGALDPEAVKKAIRRDSFPPRTALICMETTHNRCGGTVVTPEEIRDVAEMAASHDIPLHLDGSRIFNAAVALGIEAAQLAEPAKTVIFCFSKGLAAPVGSILCGTAEFIDRARQVRMVLGGQMRQAGGLAAAARVALETMVERLQEDHANARRLAEGLAQIEGLEVEVDLVQTNLVLFTLADTGLDPAEFVQALTRKGILVGVMEERLLRAVTHYGITPDDTAYAIRVFRQVLSRAAQGRKQTI